MTSLTNCIKIHVILDNIRSAYNVGSIFRTADATGCAKLYLCGITPKPGNIKLSKTALGATDFVPWEYYKDTTDAVKRVHGEGVDVFAVEITDSAENYKKVSYPDEVAFVLGHEVRGIDQRVLDLCNKCVMIPMLGEKESLNVATTAGIIMFNFLN